MAYDRVKPTYMVAGGSSPRLPQSSTYPYPWPDELVHDAEQFS